MLLDALSPPNVPDIPEYLKQIEEEEVINFFEELPITEIEVEQIIQLLDYLEHMME